ncbi:MAG: hypothetical protein PF488_01130 [Patescibacteria group bacterium]|jgi:hypothetical protein|nr:hypothetical protein [Patescibacteria group bacterium]
MKKKIIVIIVLVALANSAFSQFEEYFREKSNVVFFSGLVFKQDSRQRGSYYGAYLDYQIFKSDNGKWTFAPYGVISRSNSDLIISTIKKFSYGGGLTAGYYEEDFSFRHQLFAGLSLGLKRDEELSETINRKGRYIGVQKDLLLNTSLNLNLLKSFGLNENLFPRSQLQITWMKSIIADKKAVWKEGGESELLTDQYPWNKEYFEVLAKQNIIKIPIDYIHNFYFTPKLVGHYSYLAGDNRSFYGIGTELAIHRAYRDDFLTLGALYKVSRRMTDNYFILSLNFNLTSLLRRN